MAATSTLRPRPGPLLARAQLAGAMALAGSSVVLSKLLVDALPTFLVNMLILLPATATLLGLAWWSRTSLRAPRGAWVSLAAQALGGVVLFRVLLFYGLPLTSGAAAGILISTVPAVTALLAWMALRERLGARRMAGVALTGLGVLALTVPGASTQAGSQPLLGNLLILGAVLGEASWNVLSRVSGARLSPLAATTLVTSYALLMFLPLGLPQALTFDFGQLDALQWGLILAYALPATVMAYLLWFAGVRHVPASTAAVYTGWLPVSAVALSALLLNERLTVWHAVGLACVLGATFVLAAPDANLETH